MPTVNLTPDEVDSLLNMEKKIVIDDQMVKEYNILSKDGVSFRCNLQSLDGNEIFLLHVKQAFNRIKVNLHFQENNQYVGLLRVDYNDVHQNPMHATDNVPSIVKAYAGKLIEESHIHFCVNGYGSLKWAIPLSVSDFPIKNISNHVEMMEALDAFCKEINLTTKINYEGRLFS